MTELSSYKFSFPNIFFKCSFTSYMLLAFTCQKKKKLNKTLWMKMKMKQFFEFHSFQKCWIVWIQTLLHPSGVSSVECLSTVSSTWSNSVFEIFLNLYLILRRIIQSTFRSLSVWSVLCINFLKILQCPMHFEINELLNTNVFPFLYKEKKLNRKITTNRIIRNK